MKTTALFAASLMMTLVFGAVLPAQASEEEFEIGQSEFKLNVPKGWQAAEQVFGLPLAILGPEEEGGRAVISVVPTDMTDVKIDARKFGNNRDYQKGRKAWLKQFHGKAIEFYPYKNTKWGDSDVHQFGFKYEMNGEKYVENSFYVVCKNKLYHLKSLVTVEQDTAHGATISDSLRSFSCK